MPSDMMKYEHLLMEACKAEREGSIINPNPEDQEYMNHLVWIRYFKFVDIAPDMRGYALTPMGREEAWRTLDRYENPSELSECERV
jgi:hypothetical protein